jgi:hypothetical protein
MIRLTDALSVTDDQDMTRLSDTLSVRNDHGYDKLNRYCICHK